MKKRQLPGSTTQSSNACRPSFAGLQLDKNTNARPENLHGHVGNSEVPGDGFLYNEDRIAKAKPVSTDLQNAWSIHLDCTAFPSPRLPAMAKICLILTGMQQQHLLEGFREDKGTG